MKKSAFSNLLLFLFVVITAVTTLFSSFESPNLSLFKKESDHSLQKIEAQDIDLSVLAVNNRDTSCIRFFALKHIRHKIDRYISDHVLFFIEKYIVKARDITLSFVSFSQFIENLEVEILSSRAHPPTIY